MPHQREAIGAKVRELLLGQTAAGLRVYLNRFLTLRNRELPAVLIYPLSETVDPDSARTAPRELTRRLELAIDGLVAAENEADVAMNALALQIETALQADPYLDGVAADSILTATDLAIDTVGDRLVGRVALTFEVTYRTLAIEASEDLDDFGKVHATQNVRGPVEEADAAHDVIVVQELPDES